MWKLIMSMLYFSAISCGMSQEESVRIAILLIMDRFRLRQVSRMGIRMQ